MSDGSSITRKPALWAACALLVGCVPTLVENPPRDPGTTLPTRFREGDTSTNAPGGPTAGQQDWRTFFGDPDLQALVDAALRNNQELNIRLQEIIIAQNEVAARRGEFLPKARAAVGSGLEKVGAETSQGKADEATGVPVNLGNFAFGMTATWEVDIWGKLHGAADAADNRFRASTEGRNFLVTQLVAEIARSFFELIALDNELEVLKRNIDLQVDALQVVRIEKNAARVTELAVQRFEAEVLKNRSRLFDLEQERVQAENRINFLVGRYPQPVARHAGKLMDPLPGTLRTGLPADLLANRPDVRQAELELQAARLDVNVARANFYPSLSIDAALGYQSFNLAHLVTTPQSLLYNLAGSLTAPLLNRAAIEAEYRSANARQLQAVLNYERTVLQAFTDVANQLVRFENLQKTYDLESQQVDTLTRSVEISTVLFQSARADYMEVLLTRRDSLDAQLELIETRKRLLHSMVNIYQSLGGGWRTASGA